ncbi:MAG: hypothetical protein K2Q18_14905, partial [Bdellovibrionales bacterium]|nr:hypothetical protein [Bdellovibrionales bacterium]
AQTQKINQAPESSEGNSFLNSLFQNKKVESVIKNQVGLVGPSLRGQGKWFDRGFMVINIVLSLLLVLIGLQWFLSSRNTDVTNDQFVLIKRDMLYLKKKGLHYPELYRVLSALDKTNKMASGGVSIINIIEESGLQKESKDYFRNALTFTEGGAYAEKKTSAKLNYQKKHFKELLKNL